MPIVKPFIDVDRLRFRARLWRWSVRKRDHVVWKTYEIAVGRDGYRTPAGLHEIERKEKDPTWRPPPGEDWTKNLPKDDRGFPLPFGPDDPRNPLRGAFLALSGGDAVGFHGVPEEEYDSIGSAASHGCLRMRVPDVLDLYRRVPLWTKVFIYDGHPR